MKKIGIPSSLTDYNSLWNPLLKAFLIQVKVSQSHDVNHFLPDAESGLLYDKTKRKMVDHQILRNYGAKEILFDKDEMIFSEGEEALNYFQLSSGSVKMITNSADGKEFIQGIFRVDDSFGEPPLFCNFPYPSLAVALEPSSVWKLSKENFFKLLKENFEIHLQLDRVLCQRLRYKAMLISEISFYDPEHRILSILNHLKEETVHQDRSGIELVRTKRPYVVPYTRQQLADMSGLRVETVIRTVKKMETAGKLKLVGRKITL
jgi:CRP-like cAMP-binding protein